MKINVTQPLRDLDGQPIKDVLLRKAICDALLTPLKGDESMAGDKKAELFALAFRAHEEDEPDFRVEEVSLIKERIGRAFSPLIVGRAYALLDPSAPSPALRAV